MPEDQANKRMGVVAKAPALPLLEVHEVITLPQGSMLHLSQKPVGGFGTS